MVEVIVALGFGIVLAFLLASPAVGASTPPSATPTPRASKGDAAHPRQAADALRVTLPATPPVAPPATPSAPRAPDPSAPRKATQTAQKFK